MNDPFADSELALLRDELMRSGLDSWQAAELLSAFLASRGFGVSSDDARSAATRIESVVCNLGGGGGTRYLFPMTGGQQQVQAVNPQDRLTH